MLAAECTAATEALEAEHAQCDLDQATFEEHFCEYRRRLLDLQKSTTTCYDQNRLLFEDEKSKKMELQKDWLAEYQGLEKIKCFLDVWMSDKNVNTVDRAIPHKCQAITIENIPGQDQVSLNYLPIPVAAIVDMSGISEYPGSSGFISAYYTDDSLTYNDVVPCVETEEALTATTTVTTTTTNAMLRLWEEDFESGASDWTSQSTSAYYSGAECDGGEGSCWKFTGCNSAGDLFAKIPLPSFCKDAKCLLSYRYKGKVLLGLDGDGKKGSGHYWYPYDDGNLPVTSDWQTRTRTVAFGTSSYRHLMLETYGKACESYLDNIVIYADLPRLWDENFESGKTNWISQSTSAYYSGAECDGGEGSCWKFIGCNSAGDLFAKIPLPSSCKDANCLLSYRYKGKVLLGLDGDGKTGSGHYWYPYDDGNLPVTSDWQTRTVAFGTSSYRQLMLETYGKACESYLDGIVIIGA